MLGNKKKKDDDEQNRVKCKIKEKCSERGKKSEFLLVVGDMCGWVGVLHARHGTDEAILLRRRPSL